MRQQAGVYAAGNSPFFIRTFTKKCAHKVCKKVCTQNTMNRSLFSVFAHFKKRETAYLRGKRGTQGGPEVTEGKRKTFGQDVKKC